MLWLILFAASLPFIAGCDLGAEPTPVAVPSSTPFSIVPTATARPLPTLVPTIAGTPTPLPVPPSNRGFVPILAYHHVRDWRKSDTEDDRAYILPPAKLEEQLKALKAEGYHSVISGQVYDYFASGRALPDKPIMLSFDDNDGTQYTNAVPLLRKYGFTATFFVMTVTIDKENYMGADQLKELDKEGFDIQPHTWDHHMVTKYKTGDDWQLQIAGPKKTLEELLGHPTPYFAYPFGIYSAESGEKLKAYGYKAAFRLSEMMDDKADPLFAIKRYIANGYWTLDQFLTVVTGGWE